MTITVIESLFQATGALQSDWDSIELPIPSGMVVLATDTGNVKIGDGVTLYGNLPIAFNLTAIATFQTLLNGKANLIHTHQQSDIINLFQPNRFVFEGVVGGDGRSIFLPWNVTNIAALDVSVSGAVQFNSQLSLVNQNVIQIPIAVAPRTLVRVVWNAMVNSNGAISETSTLIISQDSWSTNPNTGVVTITLSDGDTLTITGVAIFDNMPPSFWNSAQLLPSDDFYYSNLGPTAWSTTSGLPPGIIILEGEPPAYWMSTSGGIGSGQTIFISLGAGSFLSSGLGLTSGDTILTGLNSTFFLSGGAGTTGVDIIFDSLGASAFL
jgi:hypothetical protein